MSLATNITDLATRIATEAKSLRTLINGNAADLSSLTTTSKTSLVSAINEVKAAGGGATNLDGLSDVVITTPATGHVLRHNGTNFVNALGTTYFEVAGAAATAQAAAIAASQPADGDLTTIAGLTATTDNIIQSVAGAWASRTPAQVRTALALVIGTNVQAWDADLDALAAVASQTTYGRSLLATVSAATLTATLAAATSTSSGIVELATDAETTTGTDTVRATTPANVAAAITARAATATAAGIVELATTLETTTGTDTVRAVTPAGVAAAIAALVASAPGTLDTLNELATALGNDPSFATTMTTALSNKQALHAALTSISGLTTLADRSIYTTASNTYAVYTLTAFGRSLAAAADAAAAQTLVDVYSKAQIGDPTTDFVATFNAGLV